MQGVHYPDIKINVLQSETKQTPNKYDLSIQSHKYLTKYWQIEFSYIKKTKDHDKVVFIPGILGWFSIWKSNQWTPSHQHSKQEKPMIILIDARKNLTNLIFKHGKNSQQNMNSK